MSDMTISQFILIISRLIVAQNVTKFNFFQRYGHLAKNGPGFCIQSVKINAG